MNLPKKMQKKWSRDTLGKTKMDNIKSAVYDKCQQLAKACAEKSLARRANYTRPIKPFICFPALLWVTAYNLFDKGIISEEEIKNYFHLGFVPEYSKAYEDASKQNLHIGPLPFKKLSPFENAMWITDNI